MRPCVCLAVVVKIHTRVFLFCVSSLTCCVIIDSQFFSFFFGLSLFLSEKMESYCTNVEMRVASLSSGLRVSFPCFVVPISRV